MTETLNRPGCTRPSPGCWRRRWPRSFGLRRGRRRGRHRRRRALWGLARLRAGGDARRVQLIARHRLERADLLARIPPMLGLMATIIPLGPGLAALGQGDPAQLASAVTVAFDATVLGLLAGIAGLVVGKLRRRWYDELLEAME